MMRARTLFATASALALVLAPATGLNRKASATDWEAYCTSISPDPSQVTNWYEDNPTYRQPNQDDPLLVPADPAHPQADQQILDNGVDSIHKAPGGSPLRSVLVLHNDRVAYEKYYDGQKNQRPDSQEPWRDADNVHSASKSILRMLVGIAIAQGKIASLDDPLTKYLPASYFTGDARKKNLTVRHLVEQSTGLKWREDETENTIQNNKDEPDWVKAVLGLDLIHDPGTTPNYSSGNTHVLSQVLTSATGQSTCAYAHQYLFDPLNIKAAHWGRDKQGIYSGGYNVYLRPRDMAKFGMLLLHRGSTWGGTSQEIVPATQVDEAHQQVWDDMPAPDPTGVAYGQLFWLHDVRDCTGGCQQGGTYPTYKGYWAEGFGSQYIWVIPDLNTVFVLTAQTKTDHPDILSIPFVENYLIPAVKAVG